MRTPEPTGWQPIETAPKDGTEIVLVTEGGSVVRASWQALDDDLVVWVAADTHPDSWDQGVCWASNAAEEPSDPPRWWMPLPDPPSPERREETR